jgi:hypothetical protein
MKLERLIDQLDKDVEVIIAGLAAALAHLEEWTGEYPGVASGAPPASGGSGSHVGEDDDPDEQGIVMTRLELLAMSGDPALRHRLHLLGRLRHAATLARSTFVELDGRDSVAGELTCDSEDLAVLRWAALRLGTDGEHVGAGEVDRLGRAVMSVRGLVELWQPPAPGKITGCRLHAAAGDHAEVADRFRGSQLCNRCGMFRQHTKGALPTPEILRAWSKGQKPTAGQIAEAKAAGKKKRKKRRAS